MTPTGLRVALYVVRRFKADTHELIWEEGATLLTARQAQALREALMSEKRDGEYAALEVASLETMSGSRWGS
jgi:hypothetical protein